MIRKSPLLCIEAILIGDNNNFGSLAELVDRAGLENRRPVTGSGGSNPSASALRSVNSGLLFYITIIGESNLQGVGTACYHRHDESCNGTSLS